MLNDRLNLAAYLSPLSGVSCVLPYDRIAELSGQILPAEAGSEAWWTDGGGWDAFPASRACASSGWRVESVRVDARLVRFVRVSAPASG